jgi:hypothetical protein
VTILFPWNGFQEYTKNKKMNRKLMDSVNFRVFKWMEFGIEKESFTSIRNR